MIGLFLVVMVCLGTALKRMPLTSSIIYLAFGIGLGPHGVNLLRINFFASAELLEHLMEAAVIISLFTAGLKLRIRFSNPLWKVSLRLATVSMLLSVLLISMLSYGLFDLSLGAAIILGAILSPTDPVLASDVQIAEPGDRDKLRFALTGEAGLNDGTTMPFVLLGLGLLGYHEIGESGLKWFAVDVLWAVIMGPTLGYALGFVVGQIVLYLRHHHKNALGYEEFLALGLIALTYGLNEWASANGFLGVFAAGLALRQIEHHKTGSEVLDQRELNGPAEEVATHPEKAPAFLTHAVLTSNEQLERLLEVAVVIAIGALISLQDFNPRVFLLAILLFFVIRPISVRLALLGCRSVDTLQKNLISWFGIRGMGSIFWLAYAVHHGLSPAHSREMVSIVLALVVCSILLHGISVTPLMEAYEKRERKNRSVKLTS
ncbi:MAG TPA: sodium:proton antiporter [Oligoflexus sp.]|uniref:cation:proton antiporter n=1 Tax=Oligoflexus sp. TaxID=1971216 RepID=UPI002D7F9937|nr:sodium:proton antiporter [Oligoflexus sp.]HET9241670.1 sodium:proton antiporter [Oligoflexus sp.]